MRKNSVRLEESWLHDWLAGRGNGVELTDIDNYFDAGAIDSFDAIELIEAIEGCFEIRLTESDFQDRRFATIGGLAEIIRNRRAR